jgi:hypothetical protein
MSSVGIGRGRYQIKCKFVMGGVGDLERRTLFSPLVVQFLLCTPAYTLSNTAKHSEEHA